jgi:hypothetical protein
LKPPEVDRVQPVGVLGRVHGLEDDGLRHLLGQRQLDDVAGARRVGVELGDHLEHVALGGRGRELPLDAGDADLGAVGVLGLDVPTAARVVADQQGAEAGTAPRLGERRDALGQFGADRRRGRLAVQDRRGHAGQCARETPASGAAVLGSARGGESPRARRPPEEFR